MVKVRVWPWIKRVIDVRLLLLVFLNQLFWIAEGNSVTAGDAWGHALADDGRVQETQTLTGWVKPRLLNPSLSLNSWFWTHNILFINLERLLLQES